MVKNKYREERKFVSRLIYLVLTEVLHVRDAILKFPNSVEDDPTIKTAYHALIHYEADATLRCSDFEYKQEQDDYLEFIAQIMQVGDSIPENIIKSYEKYYKDIPSSGNMKGLIRRLCKFLNV